MRTTLITLSALLTGYFMLQMSNGLQGTLLAVRGDTEGFDTAAIGLVASGFFLGMIAGSLLAGRLIESVGHVRTFAALASVASAAALVHLVVIHPVVWVGVRMLTGFCFAGLIIAVESWLNASVQDRERGKLLSIYAMVGFAGGATGQLLLDSADPESYTLFVMVSIGLSLALVPIALSRASAPVPQVAQEAPSVARLWRISPFGAVATACAGATIGIFFGLAPVFAQRVGFDASQIAYLMAAGTLGGLIFQFPMGALSDRIDRRWVCIGLALAASCLMIWLSAINRPSFSAALLIALLMGGFLLPTISIAVAHINDRAPPEALFAAAGGVVLVQGIGAASGPFLSGALMDVFGPQGFIIGLGVVQALIVAFALIRIVVQKAIEPEAKSAYTPTPVTPVEGGLQANLLLPDTESR